MSALTLAVVAGIVRRWVQLYTAGLTPALRDVRRAEIESDLWEQACDALNTHKPASLYAAFAPEEAFRILQRLEFHYTPKHASWLNPAECELSALTGQCLDRRIPDLLTLRQETSGWEEQRNQEHVMIHWRFGIREARIKLHRLYPAVATIINGTVH